jgi:hypothetical protein
MDYPSELKLNNYNIKWSLIYTLIIFSDNLIILFFQLVLKQLYVRDYFTFLIQIFEYFLI